MKKGTHHQVPHVRKPPMALATKTTAQMAMSRVAGPSERCISSFIRLRGIGV